MTKPMDPVAAATAKDDLYDFVFEGDMVTRSPVNIVTPNGPQVTVEGGKDGKAAEVATMVSIIGGERVLLPVITSTTIRGKLRSAAVEVAMRHLQGKPSLSDYLYAVVGGVKGSESEDVFSITERDARRAPNPVLALFGASAPWDGSRAYIGNAIPRERVSSEFVSSVRRDVFARDPGLASILDDQALDDYVTQRGMTKASVKANSALKEARAERAKAAKAGDAGAVKAADVKIAELDAAAKAAKSEAGNSLQMPLAHKVIPIGVTMGHKMTLMGVTEVEAGLFLASLSHLFNEKPFFGGKLSLGYGMVDGDWAVRFRKRGATGWTRAGSIAGRTLEPVELNADLEPFHRAWTEFAASGRLDIGRIAKKAA